MARITQLKGDVGPRESKISIISRHTKKDALIKHQFPTQWESPCEIYLTLNQQLRIKGFMEETNLSIDSFPYPFPFSETLMICNLHIIIKFTQLKNSIVFHYIRRAV